MKSFQRKKLKVREQCGIFEAISNMQEIEKVLLQKMLHNHKCKNSANLSNFLSEPDIKRWRTFSVSFSFS